jgi:flagellar biosynthetic protein FliQ
MSEAYVLTLAQQAITVTLMVAGPMLLISLLIGILVSIIQAATQINEVTFSFVLKVIGIVIIILLMGSWMYEKLTTFTAGLFNDLPNLVH